VLTLSLTQPPGKPGPFGVRMDGSDPPDKPPPRRPGKPWTLRVPAAAIDARNTPDLVRAHRQMLLQIERYCQRRAFTWVGNEELFAAYGCTLKVGQAHLQAMEAAGLIVRVMKPSGRPGRLGLILLWRHDQDLPVGHLNPGPGEPSIDDLARDLAAAKDAVKPNKTHRLRAPKPPAPDAPCTLKTGSMSTLKTGSTMHPENRVQKKEEVFLKKEELETTPSSSSLRATDAPMMAEASAPKTDDDDGIFSGYSKTGGGEGRGEAIQAIRLCHGEELASQIEVDAEQVGRRINGRWDYLRAAAFMATAVRKRPDNPRGWMIATANNFDPTGITEEARDAERKFMAMLASAEVRKARLATHREPAPEPPKPKWKVRLDRSDDCLRFLDRQSKASETAGLLYALVYSGWTFFLFHDGNINATHKDRYGIDGMPQAESDRLKENKLAIVALLEQWSETCSCRYK
jgi:hypothetical protein